MAACRLLHVSERSVPLNFCHAFAAVDEKYFAVVSDHQARAGMRERAESSEHCNRNRSKRARVHQRILAATEDELSNGCKRNVKDLCRSRFAAFRPVESNPNSEVGGEIFKAMRLTGGYEDEGASLDRIPLCTVEEFSATARDKINLIARVRLLRVVPLRRVEFHDERTVREDRHGQIARRRRTFGQCLDETHQFNLWRRVHSRALRAQSHSISLSRILCSGQFNRQPLLVAAVVSDNRHHGCTAAFHDRSGQRLFELLMLSVQFPAANNCSCA
jgi:hypothetical protein